MMIEMVLLGVGFVGQVDLVGPGAEASTGHEGPCVAIGDVVSSDSFFVVINVGAGEPERTWTLEVVETPEIDGARFRAETLLWLIRNRVRGRALTLVNVAVMLLEEQREKTALKVVEKSKQPVVETTSASVEAPSETPEPSVTSLVASEPQKEAPTREQNVRSLARVVINLLTHARLVHGSSVLRSTHVDRENIELPRLIELLMSDDEVIAYLAVAKAHAWIMRRLAPVERQLAVLEEEKARVLARVEELRRKLAQPPRKVQELLRLKEILSQRLP